jgi:deubiquitinase DESI2
MSFGGGAIYNGGGRGTTKVTVALNVYDLAPANEYLYPIGLGLHHSGVEILGIEYSFASGAGIFESAPRNSPGARFREQIVMGSFDGGQSQLARALDSLRPEGGPRNGMSSSSIANSSPTSTTMTFGPDDYNLIRKNCNHFAAALCWLLLKKTIPAYVNRVADVGKCCSCLLPRQFLESAPVGDSNAATESRFLVQRPGRLSQTTASNPAEKQQAFAGTGSRLGGSGSTIATSSNTAWSSQQQQDELTDRRERARIAALARLERNELQKEK